MMASVFEKQLKRKDIGFSIMMNGEIVNAINEVRRNIYGDAPLAFDGAVDEECFKQTAIRPVFLLKEVNYTDMRQDWPYTQWLHSQAYNESDRMYKTWPNVCLWLETLFDSCVSYTDCLCDGNIDVSRIRKNLAKTAIVNIKKSGGAGGSNYKEIMTYAKNEVNAALLRKQIDILEGKLIICGGTFDFAKTVWNVRNDQIMQLSTGTEYFICDEKIFLNFVHPMWFIVPRIILFAYAKEVFSDIKSLIQ